MIALSIPKACHENWENMTPVEHGAYCRSCCSNVIDFSVMRDEEIANYFQTRKGEPVCGRFRNDQLNRPLIEISPSIFMMEIPFWKKFLAALFIYFSFFITGCTSNKTKDYTTAEVPPATHKTSESRSLSKIDEQLEINSQHSTVNERPKLKMKEQEMDRTNVTMGVIAPDYKSYSEYPYFLISKE